MVWMLFAARRRALCPESWLWSAVLQLLQCHCLGAGSGRRSETLRPWVMPLQQQLWQAWMMQQRLQVLMLATLLLLLLLLLLQPLPPLQPLPLLQLLQLQQQLLPFAVCLHQKTSGQLNCHLPRCAHQHCLCESSHPAVQGSVLWHCHHHPELLLSQQQLLPPGPAAPLAHLHPHRCCWHQNHWALLP